MDPVSDAGRTSAAEAIVAATGRTTLKDAIAWLAEDHPMPADTQWSALLRALVTVVATTEVENRALRRVVRQATASDVDPAKVLFNVGSLAEPAKIAAAIDKLLARSADGTFGGLTPKGVLHASLDDEFAIECLCLAAGVAYRDIVQWFRRGNSWQLEDVEAALDYMNSVIERRAVSPFPDAEPARGVEFLQGGGSGWTRADDLRRRGVPYELFLAQRAVGGAWLAHKNRTSSFPNIAAAEALCERLDRRNIDFRRSTNVGGSVKQGDLQTLSGVRDKRVGVVAMAGMQPRYVIGFSTASNGGTARANGDGLLQIPTTGLPFAFVLTGPGWTARTETDRLARKFAGRLFTDRTLDDLVDEIAVHVS